MHASLQLFVRLRFHSELGITNFGYVRNPPMSISRSISTTKQEWNNNLVNYSKENNKILGQFLVYMYSIILKWLVLEHHLYFDSENSRNNFPHIFVSYFSNSGICLYCCCIPYYIAVFSS